MAKRPSGIHLVGSVPLTDAEEVFTDVSNVLGNHLKRIPDGETGERSNWVEWQLPIMDSAPALQVVEQQLAYGLRQQVQLCPGCSIDTVHLERLGYAEAAIASYRTFRELKAKGEIGKGCRFQVSLPTPLAIPHLYVSADLQQKIEVEYEHGLLRDIAEILDVIPHDELALQWDMAVEFAIIEGVLPSYIDDIWAGIAERLPRLCDAIPDAVELGFHLCYGDSKHKHFCEPKDCLYLVKVANLIERTVSRRVDWIHMPVPKERDDSAYFAPLRDLDIAPETELYLGLVHHGDGTEGTRRRIATAQEHIPEFGVATECGFGRRSPDTIREIMQIHTAVSAPLA